MAEVGGSARPGGPSAAWAAGIAAGRWQHDPAQAAALVELDRIHRELLAAGAAGRGLFGWLRRAPPVPVRGLYLWGGVGRGKTFLNDLLVDSLGDVPRRRWHFHRFMVEMHG